MRVYDFERLVDDDQRFQSQINSRITRLYQFHNRESV